jgi:hypothetical protein
MSSSSQSYLAKLAKRYNLNQSIKQEEPQQSPQPPATSTSNDAKQTYLAKLEKRYGMHKSIQQSEDEEQPQQQQPLEQKEFTIPLSQSSQDSDISSTQVTESSEENAPVLFLPPLRSSLIDGFIRRVPPGINTVPVGSRYRSYEDDDDEEEDDEDEDDEEYEQDKISIPDPTLSDETWITLEQNLKTLEKILVRYAVEFPSQFPAHPKPQERVDALQKALDGLNSEDSKTVEVSIKFLLVVLSDLKQVIGGTTLNLDSNRIKAYRRAIDKSIECLQDMRL